MPRPVLLATCARAARRRRGRRRAGAALGRRAASTPRWAVWDDPERRLGRRPRRPALDLGLHRRPDAFLAWVDGCRGSSNPADGRRVELRQALPARPRRRPACRSCRPCSPRRATAPSTFAARQRRVRGQAVGRGRFARRRPVHPRTRSAAARRHIAELHAAGRTVMVQPYLAAVDTRRDALIYVDGRFSHAIRKGPMLPRGVAHPRRRVARSTSRRRISRGAASRPNWRSGAAASAARPRPVRRRPALHPGRSAARRRTVRWSSSSS